jgi:endonuclease/exonuclease/phosphatase (EEP) superfamily protein YafD
MQLRHTLTICLLIPTIALLAISIAAYIPGLWLCDLASQLRLAWFWALLPIAAIFVDGSLRVKSRVAGPAINSDHLPVTVVLEL